MQIHIPFWKPLAALLAGCILFAVYVCWWGLNLARHNQTRATLATIKSRLRWVNEVQDLIEDRAAMCGLDSQKIFDYVWECNSEYGSEVRGGKRVLLDAWDNEMAITAQKGEPGTIKIIVSSAGWDGWFETTDDLAIEVVIQCKDMQ